MSYNYNQGYNDNNNNNNDNNNNGYQQQQGGYNNQQQQYSNDQYNNNMNQGGYQQYNNQQYSNHDGNNNNGDQSYQQGGYQQQPQQQQYQQQPQQPPQQQQQFNQPQDQQQQHHQQQQQQQYMQDNQEQQQPTNTYTFTVHSATQGDYSLELSHQDSLATLYRRVQERFRADEAYLKYNERRLPNTPGLISNYISIAIRETIRLDFVTAALDDVITVKYMCEKCGHIFNRSPDDAIECPQNTCRHGILLKCRKEGTITSYDCR